MNDRICLIDYKNYFGVSNEWNNKIKIKIFKNCNGIGKILNNFFVDDYVIYDSYDDDKNLDMFCRRCLGKDCHFYKVNANGLFEKIHIFVGIDKLIIDVFHIAHNYYCLI